MIHIKARIEKIEEQLNKKYNRSERRKFLKRGIYLPYMDAVNVAMYNDGDKVKINYQQITGRKDWKRKLSNYKQFVKDNKDKIFTIVKDSKYNAFVTLQEDTTDPKWMFWVGDLIKTEEDI